MTFREFDYPLTEIAANSSVGWSTIHSFWHRLVEMGIVIQTRQVGRAKLYKLNVKNPVVQELIRLDSMITKHFTDLVLKKEEMMNINHSPSKS